MKEEIINYKLADFLKQDPELIDEYRVLLTHIKSIQTKKEIFYMKFKHVELIKENLQSGEVEDIVEIISKVQKIGKDDIYNMDILTFYGLLNSVKEQIKTINDAEITALTSNQTNFRWEAVGGSEKMKQFGTYTTLDMISNGDITKWDTIMNIDYADIFTKLYMNRVKDDLQAEMEQMKTK